MKFDIKNTLHWLVLSIVACLSGAIMRDILPMLQAFSSMLMVLGGIGTFVLLIVIGMKNDLTRNGY